jgi:hypothetical protein
VAAAATLILPQTREASVGLSVTIPQVVLYVYLGALSLRRFA